MNKLRIWGLLLGIMITLSGMKAQTYDSLWKQVETLEQKGLPKSAIVKVEEIYEKAKAEKKYVLINFHTKTCAPCKKMEKTVFPTPQCGEYINKHFIPITIDGEDNGTGTEIAKKYSVFIFPTYLILSPECFKEGEILGAEFDIDKFLEMLKTIIHDV